jgi:hypothetical protein
MSTMRMASMRGRGGFVHHAKNGAGRARAGQALRGSSEFHAWGGSNLYLRRNGDDLSLSVEHRAPPSMLWATRFLGRIPPPAFS